MTNLAQILFLSATMASHPGILQCVKNDGATALVSPRRGRVPQFPDSTIQSVLPSVDASSAVDSPEVYLEIAELFRVPEDEYFENGYQSDFGGALSRAIRRLGERAIDPVSHIITTQRARPHVIEEALRVLGRLQHEATKPYRRSLLERSLESSNPYMRDAAGLGIADMDDPASIPALRQAIAVESSRALRKDLTMVLRQLESHGTTASETR